jgi:chorismate synthase
MKDKSLLNELDIKVRQLVASLERERAKNAESNETIIASEKLGVIKNKIENLTNLIDQLEKA